jgi:Flp pilus assembly protein TadD
MRTALRILHAIAAATAFAAFCLCSGCLFDLHDGSSRYVQNHPNPGPTSGLILTTEAGYDGLNSKSVNQFRPDDTLITIIYGFNNRAIDCEIWKMETSQLVGKTTMQEAGAKKVTWPRNFLSAGTYRVALREAGTVIQTEDFKVSKQECLTVVSNQYVFNLNQAPVALQAAAKPVIQDPHDPDRWVEYAKEATRCGYLNDAELALHRAELEYSTRGAQLHNQGRYQEALDCYDKALALNPEDATAWMNGGLALFALGKDNQALKCLNKAVKLQRDNDQAWSSIGIVLQHVGEVAAAADCYKIALKLNPDNTQAKTNLSLLQ